MEFDLRIIALLVFIWGVLNLTTGYIEFNALNMSKGVVAIGIAAHLFYFAKKIIVLHG